MGKLFIKFRVFRSLPTFHSCRPKDSSSAVKSTAPPPQQPKPHRHVSSSFLTACQSISGPQSFPEECRTKSSSFKWGKDPKWHIIAKIPEYTHEENDGSAPPRRKIYSSADENDVVLFPPLQLKKRRHPRRRRFRGREGSGRRRSFQKVSFSSSSGLFSDDFDEGENSSTTTPRASAAAEPARLSEFIRRVAGRPCRAVKVRESYAVVKRSEDPYEDFRRSMAEMVVEKRMFEAEELEELLRCFLQLNSVHHHEAIVRAFTEIWEALFAHNSLQGSS